MAQGALLAKELQQLFSFRAPETVELLARTPVGQGCAHHETTVSGGPSEHEEGRVGDDESRDDGRHRRGPGGSSAEKRH